MFIKYPKIYALGKEENEGILDVDEIIVQEKLDGANTSIWLEGGEVHGASRNKEITEGFNGFCDYIQEHEGIRKVLNDNPNCVLYGEWLVRHTISYNETAYKKFYLFDIFNMDSQKFLSQGQVQSCAKEYAVDYPQIFYGGPPSGVNLDDYVGTSEFGDKGEGVVVKAHGFINQFGDHAYAKVVTQDFKEGNALVFGGNNKDSDTYWEMYVVNKYCTLARVQKIMNKIQPEVDKRLDKEHTPRIANTCYHDLLTEDIWEVANKVEALNFKKLKMFCSKKFIQIYHDILNNNISVADYHHE